VRIPDLRGEEFKDLPRGESLDPGDSARSIRRIWRHSAQAGIIRLSTNQQKLGKLPDRGKLAASCIRNFLEKQTLETQNPPRRRGRCPGKTGEYQEVATPILPENLILRKPFLGTGSLCLKSAPSGRVVPNPNGGIMSIAKALPKHLRPRREKVFGLARGFPHDRNARVRIQVYVLAWNARRMSISVE
jgi:hypothetical protein